MDGVYCRPFDDKVIAFRCPAECQATIISNPQAVGGYEYNYRNIVIGGSNIGEQSERPVYRGDSFLCAAAIHAGIFRGSSGGAGLLSLVGERKGFASVEAHGLTSIAFSPSFPQSFAFLDSNSKISTWCKDPRWTLLFVTAIFTTSISILTTSSAAFFGSIFFNMYFFVALAFDPPDFKTYPSVISKSFRGFLPAAFVGVVMYYSCVRRTLDRISAQMEKTVLWLGGCWLGCLNNVTFDRLPIQRLTPHDFQQPGAILTVSIIFLVITTIAVAQAWTLRLEGRLPYYLKFYTLVGLILLALMAIPGLNVRLHHYILALILLPGTAVQTRPSLFYQGLLIGLFISGIARWGFDSIVQTPSELFEFGYNEPIPQISAPSIAHMNTDITFSWSNEQNKHDGISVVVNDVERFRGSEDDDLETFTWRRQDETEVAYFRFAYVKFRPFERSLVGRYTKPGRWNTNGTYEPPETEDLGLTGTKRRGRILPV